MRRMGMILLLVGAFFSFTLNSNSSFAGVPIGSSQSSINSDTFSGLYEKSRSQVVLILAIGTGLGSGFIWTNDGYILTNNHVVEAAKAVEVYIDDRKHYPAKVVGYDSEFDVAVLKIDTGLNLTAVALGNSDQVKVGNWVYAVGAPLGLKDSLSVGVVGGPRRYVTSGIQEVIQLDITLSSGNSGGPLYDLRGKVIGMNVMKSKDGGLGFAIPINDVIFVAKEILKNGKVKYSRLGVALGELAEVFNEDIARDRKLTWPLPQKQGIMVVEVEPGAPANRAGLEREDIIVSFNNKPVDDLHKFRRELAFSPSGVEILMVVRRAGREINLRVRLEDRSAIVNKKEEKEEPPAVPTPTPIPAPTSVPTPGPTPKEDEVDFGNGLDLFPNPVKRAIKEYQGLLSEISVGIDQQVRVRSTNTFAVDSQYIVTVSSFLNPDAHYASVAKYVFNGISAKLSHVSPWGLAMFKLERPYANYKTPIVWSDDVKVGSVYISLVIKDPVNGDNLPYIRPLLNQVSQALVFNAVMKKNGLGAPIFNAKGEIIGMWFVQNKDFKDPDDVYDSTVAMPAGMIKKMVESVTKQQK